MTDTPPPEGRDRVTAAAADLVASPHGGDGIAKTVRDELPSYLAARYGIDLNDDDQARAVFAVLDWSGAAAKNAHALGMGNPWPAVLQSMIAASRASAETITRNATTGDTP